MFGETTFLYVMIGNHPIETTIKNWLFGVPGLYRRFFSSHLGVEDITPKKNL